MNATPNKKGIRALFRLLKQQWRHHQLARQGIVPIRQVPCITLGQGGGAWVICPTPLSPESIVYSFGVGTEISFDLAVQTMIGAHVDLFDPTPRSIAWIARQTLPDGLDFHPYGLGDKDGEIIFYPSRKSGSSHFSPLARYRHAGTGGTVKAQVFRLSSILRKLKHQHLDVLKIDIEGGEYAVIDDILSSGIHINQLLLEFHHAYATIPRSKTINAIAHLRLAGFELFYISPRTYEMSFIHQRLLEKGR